jgi:MFS-type transporter involved in bile tolerance (Atg22 family)
MAPFAVVAPLLGPWIDRAHGGRRSMVVLSAAGRVALCVLMVDDLDGLLLFPEALAVLVLAKGYSVARASLVPGLVRDESELVEANARLILILGVSGFVAALPGLLVLEFLGAEWVLVVAALAFAGATVMALRIPATRVADRPPAPAEQAELRSRGVLLGASAMALLRAVVGFLAFHLAFWYRGDGAPTWWFGLVLAASSVGSLLGAALAPRLRRVLREERILLACLVVTTLAALGALWLASRPSGAVLALVVGITAQGARLSFDAIVQRDAPDANYGRSFARFETRFQLAWVVGAAVPVLVHLPLGAGYAVVAVLAGVAAVSYATGHQVRAAWLRRVLPRRRSAPPRASPSRPPQARTPAP